MHQSRQTLLHKDTLHLLNAALLLTRIERDALHQKMRSKMYSDFQCSVALHLTKALLGLHLTNALQWSAFVSASATLEIFLETWNY